jgi:hypothetical protein
MKEFKSDGVIFTNALSYALDNQNTSKKFAILWMFLCHFAPDAVEEFRVKRNFVGYPYMQIEKTLKDIGRLD